MHLTREAGPDAFIAAKYVEAGGTLENADQYLASLGLTEELRGRTKDQILELLDPERLAKAKWLPKRGEQGE